MERGWFHPERGYWQTTGNVPAIIRDGYPEGTIEVHVKPGQHYEWSGTDWEYVAPEITAGSVNAERDRRLQADFEFHGKMYQRDAVSLQRIAGKATLAGFAIAAGAQSGNLRWDNPERDFGWIASDNTITPMDAQTCFAFGQAAAAVETRLVFAAKQLRDMDPIPADYTDNKWW